MPTNRNRVGSHTQGAMHDLQTQAQNLGHNIGQMASQRMHDLSDLARDRTFEMQREVEDRIVRKPLQSIAIAAGVGILIGLMFRRS